MPLGINKYIVNTMYEVSKDIKKEIKGTKIYTLKRLNFKLKNVNISTYTLTLKLNTLKINQRFAQKGYTS